MNKVKESFEWMAPEFKVVDAGKSTIRIKGVAMKSNVVSRNKRKYVDEELKKSARTWIGKPVTVNHDMHRKIGDVKWMEYEKGALEYLADIKKEPYVSMLRDGSTKIRGVSIEANYLHNRCGKCGDRFYTEEEFHKHMHEAHFINTDPTKEVHGMFGTALSLVLSPEEPGFVGSTVDLMEMYQRPVLQLLETVITHRKEKDAYLKKLKKVAVVQPESRQTFDKQVREQALEPEVAGAAAQDTAHPSPDETPKCDAGFHWDPELNTCVEDPVEHKHPEHPEVNITEPPTVPEKTTQEQEAAVCPQGFHEEPAGSGICIADEVPEVTPPVDAPTVEEPTIPKDLVTHTASEQEEQHLEPVPHPAPEEAPVCPDGTHMDPELGTCVPNEIPEVVTTEAPVPDATKVLEVKLPKKLSLGEPFADYADHADCVAKNQDKEDPDAYCADIKRKTEGDAVEEMYAPKKAYIRDIKLATQLNKLEEAIAAMYLKIKAGKKATRKMVLTESKLRHAYDRGTAKRIFMELGKLQTMVKKIKEYEDKKLSQLASAIGKNTLTIQKSKADFDKTLAVADTNVKEINKRYDELKKRVKEQEEEPPKPEPCPEGQHRNEEGKCVPDEPPEAEETKKKLEEMAVKVDNLESKLKGQFKAHSPPVKESKKPKGHVNDPTRRGKK